METLEIPETPEATGSGSSLQQTETDHVKVLYEMYGLGDFPEDSFNFQQYGSEFSQVFLQGKKQTDQYNQPETDGFSDVGFEGWNSCDSGSFASSTTRLPRELLYSPNVYMGDHLAFPDYMMVHSHSGMPVLVGEDSSSLISYSESSQGSCSKPPVDAALDADSLLGNGSGHSGWLNLLSPPSYSSVTYINEFNREQQIRNALRGPRLTVPVSCSVKRTSPTLLKPRRGRPPVAKQVYIFPEIEKKIELPEKENLPSSDTDSEDATLHHDEDAEMELDLKRSPTSSDGLSSRSFCKPPYSYSALVTFALKNSKTGRLTVRDIYNFMCHHFPYFRSAASGWKNSVRHNLSLNPGFLKIVSEVGPAKSRTACRWTLNPDRYKKMNEELLKFRMKSLDLIKRSMRNPDLIYDLEAGTFSNFSRATIGVTVEEKKIGQRRRNKNQKAAQLELSVPPASSTAISLTPGFIQTPVKEESSVDSYQSGTSCSTRSPLTMRPFSPMRPNPVSSHSVVVWNGYEGVPVIYQTSNGENYNPVQYQ